MKKQKQKKQNNECCNKTTTLKFDTFEITYRELPNETSLSVAVTNCPLKCKGCHSPQLREDIGTPLTEMDYLIEKYKDHITAICYLGHGGRDHIEQFTNILKDTKEKYPELKLGLYSGYDDIIEEFEEYLDYYKVGPYIEKLGGLDSPATNQIMYKKMKSPTDNKKWEDIGLELMFTQKD